MSNPDLLRLMTWLSPAFPVGAYTYSHGLEAAIEQGWVTDRSSLQVWLDDLLEFGAPRNDGIFIQAVFAGGDPLELDELAQAMQPARELLAESVGQGKALLRAMRQVWPDLTEGAPKELTYPVALALAAKAARLDGGAVIQAYLHAFIANLVSAAVRAIPLGQTDGLLVLAAFEGKIQAQAAIVQTLTLDDLGSSVMRNDLASMLHETQHTRLFRS